MSVTIIGAGNMGRGIATRFLRGGHSITLIDRDQDQAAELAQQLRSEATRSATIKASAPGGGPSSKVSKTTLT